LRREATITITNPLGLHARPAMALVETASGYNSSVKIRKGTQEVDGKSIMQVMMLAATQGTELHLIAEGDDADAVIERLITLCAADFDDHA